MGVVVEDVGVVGIGVLQGLVNVSLEDRGANFCRELVR